MGRPEKRRKKDGKKKSLPVSRRVIAAIALLCLLAAGGYFSLGPWRHGKSKPVYEEIYSVKTRLQQKISEIDVVIYDALYREGVGERDIRFPDVEPRHQDGQVWDFTVISVNSLGKKQAEAIFHAVLKGLSSPGSDIRVRREPGPGAGIICHVYAGNFYTHRVILGTGGPEKGAEDLRPRIAIIIDDMGYDLKTGLSFLNLPMPLTISVLPCAPYTNRIAEEARKKGREILLLLPMEPKHYPRLDPGPGALLLSMGDREILNLLDRDLSDVPGVSGVNNHMGSSFTENRGKMRLVLGELKKKHLFYIDSRTTRKTVGVAVARGIGLPAAGRNVFLDNDLEPAAITIQWRRLISIARHSGGAIGIGHPHRETLMVLKRSLPSLGGEIRIVPVSE